MSLSIQSLAAVLKNSGSVKELATLLKLANIEVLTKSGSDTYLIKHSNTQLNAQSQAPLESGSKYLANVVIKDSIASILEQVKLPNLQAKLEAVSHHFSAKDILQLLRAETVPQDTKQTLLELMSKSSSKEEFNAFSQLLLSLNQNIISLPFRYENYFSLFQMRKKRTQSRDKEQVEFYAMFEHLGVIDGTISLVDDELYLALHVAFLHVKTFLEEQVASLKGLHVKVQLSSVIEPLFEIHNDTILDCKV